MKLRLSLSTTVLLVFFLSLPASWAGNDSPTPLWRSRGAIVVYCGALVAGSAFPVVKTLMTPLTPAQQRSMASVDLDHDRRISEVEMNGLGTSALVELLQRVEPNELPKIIDALTDAKLGWVLLESPSVEWKNQWLLPIAQKEPKRVARMMLALREPDSNMRDRNELNLLEGLPDTLKASVLKQWRLLDDNAGLPAPEDSNTVGMGQDDRSTLEIPQNGYIFTNVAKHKRVQTFGVGPCIAVTLWDPKTQSGVLAHMHAKNAAEVALDFDRMLAEFQVRGIAVNNLEVGMVGGWDELSNGLVFNIRNRLLAADISAAQFKYVNTLQRVKGNIDVELDLSSGKVSIYTETSSNRTPAQTMQGIEDTVQSFDRPIVRHPESL
jgi:chemotaxis receptor (MCP) glutamine deamidase CheD